MSLFKHVAQRLATLGASSDSFRTWRRNHAVRNAMIGTSFDMILADGESKAFGYSGKGRGRLEIPGEAKDRSGQT
jgi:hypothetical protein